DRVTSPRVASCAGLTLTEPETTKAPQVYPLLRLQRRHDGLQESGDHLFCLVLRQLHSGGDLINEICLRHTSLLWMSRPRASLARVKMSGTTSVGCIGHSCQAFSQLGVARSCRGDDKSGDDRCIGATSPPGYPKSQ